MRCHRHEPAEAAAPSRPRDWFWIKAINVGNRNSGRILWLRHLTMHRHCKPRQSRLWQEDEDRDRISLHPVAVDNKRAKCAMNRKTHSVIRIAVDEDALWDILLISGIVSCRGDNNNLQCHIDVQSTSGIKCRSAEIKTVYWMSYQRFFHANSFFNPNTRRCFFLEEVISGSRTLRGSLHNIRNKY